MFVNLQGLILAGDPNGISQADCTVALQSGQAAMQKVQAAVHHMEGQARQPRVPRLCGLL